MRMRCLFGFILSALTVGVCPAAVWMSEGSISYPTNVPGAVRRCLVLEDERQRLGLLPAADGCLVGVAGATDRFADFRALAETSVDWRLFRNRRTGTSTVWIGGSEPRGTLRWSLGFTPLSDRRGFSVQGVFVNRGGSAVTNDLWRLVSAALPTNAAGPWALARIAPWETRIETREWVPADESAGTNAVPASPSAPGRGVDPLKATREACLGGDWRTAVACADAALARGACDPAAHVVKAFALRKQGRFPESSKQLRLAAALDPLDPWGVAERAFLDDDGEDAVRNVCAGRGSPAKTVDSVIRAYRRIGAKQEAEILRLQAQQAGISVTEVK